MPGQTLRIETARAFKPLLSPSRYKGAHGGRASAKSHFFAELCVERSIQAHTDIVCLREVQKSLQFSSKRTIEGKIQALNAGAYFEVQDKLIRSYPTAGPDRMPGVILFDGLQAHTAESLKSLEAFDVAWADEAQTLAQSSLDILRPTFRKDGSELWFSWNPRSKNDPVDALLRGATPPPNSIVVQVNYADNPWLPQASRDEIEYDKRRDPDKYRHIWLGEYLQHSDARVFKNWTIEEFERPPGTIYRLGADWGFASDPSVLVRCSIDGNRLYIDHEAYMIGCEIINLPDLFDRVPESRKWFITADSARPETISHMRSHGYPKINAAIKGPKSIEEGVEWLKSFDIIVHPRCVHTIDELTLYSYKLSKEVDPATQQQIVLPILEDKQNHVIDALRYACEGARRMKPPVVEEDHSPPPRRGGWMAS